MTQPAPVGADRQRSRWRSRRTLIAVIVTGTAIAVLDQISKQWALWHLDPHRTIPLVGELLGLRLAFNTGAAFSLGSDTTWILSLASTVVVIGLLTRTVLGIPPKYTAGVGVLLGGAVGNLLDRLARGDQFGSGVVVDMINYANLAIGNIADIAIAVGVGLLALTYARTSPSKRRHRGATTATTNAATSTSEKLR
ncbi:signal peptidase II [Curtobacterium sp. 1P10AnD]|jgi:signal peptidase II|uniref:Lipoprotein signal peptidase n=3 Tax=Curtobacterium TaxID=2034 RepID=A0ABT7TRE4_9MICO|nr:MULTISPECIES: signal peptidase II [Curtobacterium]MCM3506438.1 signal peptidase II [Curtobacterium sp. ODYSSEY 48 V2]MCM3522623.1 signal peptidase II [Curtobacterium sp. P97]MDM7884769.1 signal peptidase II [Curtobacterium citri]MDM7892179.1 signal peptidase II [Curtobacterium caseinilyticum]NUU26946.1 signal peptidase II [Curtobacterium albidum]